MKHVTHSNRRKWIKPAGIGGGILTTLAVLGAQLKSLRGDVETIQASKPDVVAAEVSALKEYSKQASEREDRDMRAINETMSKLREDVSFIRGLLDPDRKAPVGEGRATDKVAGSFQQSDPAARG